VDPSAPHHLAWLQVCTMFAFWKHSQCSKVSYYPPQHSLCCSVVKMSPAIHPTRRETVSFNSAQCIASKACVGCLTCSNTHSFIQATLPLHTLLSSSRQPVARIHPPGSRAATQLHLQGYVPGAGSTHNPLCSCQKCYLSRAASWPPIMIFAVDDAPCRLALLLTRSGAWNVIFALP
jgi:hypothetical protein